MADFSTESMQQAVQPKIEGSFRDTFFSVENLPEPLNSLDRISQNFYWSWQPEGVKLFRELDNDLWTEVEQNPRLLLKRVGELRLWQAASDDDYLARLGKFTDQFDAYTSDAVSI